MRKGKFALALFVFSLLLAPAALADSLSFTLARPVQSGAPGTTFSFMGTVTALSSNTGNIYLNGDSFTLPGLGSKLDDTAFFSNFPFFLTPGQSATDVLFTISTLPTSQRGAFTGSFSILGGGNATTFTNLATVNYAVNVTPEPSSLVLLGTGLTGAFGVLRRRRMLRA